MKVKIKSFNGNLPEYLTEGKTYGVLKKVTIDGQTFFNIITDNGNIASVNHNDLNGGSWEIVNE